MLYFLNRLNRKELASLTAAYWHGQDSGERAMCISFGLFFLVLSMGVLVIDESILEFGLENGKWSSN